MLWQDDFEQGNSTKYSPFIPGHFSSDSNDAHKSVMQAWAFVKLHETLRLEIVLL